LPEAQAVVYGDARNWFPSQATRAVHQVAPVDYLVHGCPIYPEEFLRLLKAALA